MAKMNKKRSEVIEKLKERNVEDEKMEVLQEEE